VAKFPGESRFESEEPTVSYSPKVSNCMSEYVREERIFEVEFFLTDLRCRRRGMIGGMNGNKGIIKKCGNLCGLKSKDSFYWKHKECVYKGLHRLAKLPKQWFAPANGLFLHGL
jgi:hypothetical protein